MTEPVRDEDFAEFLDAVREFEDESPVRSTAHTSSVASGDWELVQAEIAARRD